MRVGKEYRENRINKSYFRALSGTVNDAFVEKLQ